MAPLSFSNAWLQAVICVAFVAAAVYQFASVTVSDDPSVNAFQAFWMTNSIGLGVMYLTHGLLGAACLLRSSYRKAPRKSDAPQVPADWDKVVRELRVQDAEESSEKPAALAPASASEEALAPAPMPRTKAKLYFLTHMKTFLTFIVVTYHIVGQFTFHIMQGVGTTNGVKLGASDASIATIAQFVFGNVSLYANLFYFMAAFFFISGIFCPKSLDKKGFCVFVLDKLMRLGGPFLFFNFVLGPLLTVASNAFGGQPLPHYTPAPGPTWFIFWLLNFSVLYAVIAQVMPVIRFKMPHPVLVSVVSVALGIALFAMNYPLGLSTAPWGVLWNNVSISMLVTLYIPFFAAGIIAGRSGWLETIVSRPQWLQWIARAYIIICVALLATGFVLCPDFGAILDTSGHNPMNRLSWIAAALVGRYSVAMTLTLIQLFHQRLNFKTKFMGAMGAAAYAVYIIHPWIFNLWIMVFVEILKAAHVPIVFQSGGGGPCFFTTDAAGNSAALSGGMLWGGQTFVFVLTQLTVWPIAYYLRKLPVLNKML